MPTTVESTILLIAQDEEICSVVRGALAHDDATCRVSAVASFAAARLTVADLSPDLIILQGSFLPDAPETSGGRPLPLADMVATLAGFAPVVVLGDQAPPASLAALVAAGAADFVPFVTGGELGRPEISACFEKHLHSARRLIPEFCAPNGVEQPTQSQSFGEMLRHELNNPLTGILGNAELLLAETRRQNNAVFSAPGVRRLETIAALAVRMRETVRRLSQACESREEHARSL